MRTKNTILFSLISTFFLIFLISIWKILATLQGLSINSFNIEIIFIFGFLISLAHLGIGDRIKSIYKSIIFSSIFVFCDGYLIQKLPIWYNVGVFLILYFFTNKISKYTFIGLKEEHSTQVILFDFLTLFGILFFSFVILFPFYMMFVTSFKTQIALLVNPLDFSINFTQDLKDLFKDVIAKSGGMPDPIALQSTSKDVKISRAVADNFDLPAMSKKYGIKITPGEGSRGGRGTKSKGFGFEGQITKDIETYIAEGVDSQNFTYPKFIREFHTLVLSKHDDIRVKLEGGANTRRPLQFTDIGVLIKGRDLQIGNLITDVTVYGDDKTYYLSLKLGGTTTFFNSVCLSINLANFSK